MEAASGAVKGKGTQPKLTEFYQNKKARPRSGSGSHAGDAPVGDKAQRMQRKTLQALATGPEEDSAENEGRDSMSDSGLCPLLIRRVYLPMILPASLACGRWGAPEGSSDITEIAVASIEAGKQSLCKAKSAPEVRVCSMAISYRRRTLRPEA